MASGYLREMDTVVNEWDALEDKMKRQEKWLYFTGGICLGFFMGIVATFGGAALLDVLGLLD